MNKYFGEMMESLNSSKLTLVDRLEFLDSGQAGAAIFIAQTPGKAPYITIGLNLTSTLVDRQDTDTYGAPTASEFLDEDLSPQFTDDLDTPVHLVLASLGCHTRDQRLTTSNFYARSSPVLFTQGLDVGAKVGTEGPFKVILLPPLCSAPVGFYWPADSGKAAIQATLADLPTYKPFSHLLDQQDQKYLTQWFDGVQAAAHNFVVAVSNAKPFFQLLPMATTPSRTGSLTSILSIRSWSCMNSSAGSCIVIKWLPL
jgi:hypothetical protein